jgi:hypothetical protein
MADPHVLTGLIAKRAEIAGQIESTQDQFRQLVIDLDHIDAAIHIFDPSIELEELKSRPVPPKHQAFRGEVSWIVPLPRHRIDLTSFSSVWCVCCIMPKESSHVPPEGGTDARDRQGATCPL